MFSFLKKNPSLKLRKSYNAILKQAMQAQRKGDIKLYSELTDQAEQILQQIDSLK